MVNISKQESKTIDDYVFHNQEFRYVLDTAKYYSYPVKKEKLINSVLDDYLRMNKTQGAYQSKVNALRMFTIRVKTWDKNNYTTYEEL